MLGGDVRDRVRVGCWRSRCFVASDHPAPHRVCDRIDEALRNDLSSVVASALTRQPMLQGEDLIFVRRLELDVSVDAGWDRGRIAQACGVALSRTLGRELRAGDPSNVVRFRNRAELVAAYLTS